MSFRNILVSSIERADVARSEAPVLEYRKPNTGPPSPPPAAIPTVKVGGPKFRGGLFIVDLLTALFYLGGFIGLLSAWGESSHRLPYAARFQSDNAIGAVANAMERATTEGEGFHMIVVALMTILVAVGFHMCGHVARMHLHARGMEIHRWQRMK